MTFKSILFCAFLSVIAVPVVAFAEQDNILTDAEREWLQAHMPIRMAVHPNDPPIEYLNEDGVYSGIASDFISVLESRLNIRFKMERFNTWDEAVAKACAHEIDMLACATKTPYREQYLTFTKSYLNIPAVIITRKSTLGGRTIRELSNKLVAVPYRYSLYEHLLAKYKDLHIVDVPDARVGLQKLSTGEVDALISNVAIAIYWIEKDGISNVRISGDADFMFKWAVAARNDMPQLFAILEKGLSSIAPQERVAIYRKWISYGRSVIIFRQREVVTVLVGLLFVLLLIIGTIIWNRMLQTQVGQKTKELQIELDVRRKVERELEQLRDHLEEEVKNKTSALMETQEKLIRNERLAAMGQVGGTIAHEFRNQLGIMKNVVFFLTMRLKGKECDSDGKVLRHLDILREQVDETDKIIANILTYARAKRPEYKEIPIHEMLATLIDKTKERKHAVSITTGFDGQVTTLQGDEIQLQQVFENIIINALDAMAGVGSLSVTTQKKGTFVVITFRDTGCGIPADIKAKLFDPFFSTKARGTGLGLATAKNIIEAHNGVISVESKVGAGTSVIVTLPLKQTT